MAPWLIIFTNRTIKQQLVGIGIRVADPGSYLPDPDPTLKKTESGFHPQNTGSTQKNTTRLDTYLLLCLDVDEQFDIHKL